MKRNKKIITITLTLIMMSILLCSSVYAATGFQGYAIYRDGVYGLWHAGMMDSAYSTDSED